MLPQATFQGSPTLYCLRSFLSLEEKHSRLPRHPGPPQYITKQSLSTQGVRGPRWALQTELRHNNVPDHKELLVQKQTGSTCSRECPREGGPSERGRKGERERKDRQREGKTDRKRDTETERTTHRDTDRQREKPFCLGRALDRHPRGGDGGLGEAAGVSLQGRISGPCCGVTSSEAESSRGHRPYKEGLWALFVQKCSSENHGQNPRSLKEK